MADNGTGKDSGSGFFGILRKILSTIGNFFRGRQKIVFIALAVLFVLGIAGRIAYRYWERSQPQPLIVKYSIIRPENIDFQNKVYPPVRISFQGSAAIIEEIGKTPAFAPEITPAVNGVWTWNDDRTLEFVPSDSWQIGEHYQVTMPTELFAEHIELQNYRFNFEIPPFKISFSDSQFYIDPQDSKIKRVLGTLRSNYPFDPESFKDKIVISPQISARSGQLENREYGYDLTFNEENTIAYIVSEPVGMPASNVDMKILVKKGISSRYGGKPDDSSLNRIVTVPGITSFVKVKSINHSLVKNNEQQYEQIFTIQTKGEISLSEISTSMEVRLLPKDRPELPGLRGSEDHRWGALDEMIPEVLSKSRAIDIEGIPNEREYSSVNSFRFDSEPGRYVYLKLKEGMKFYGGYYLAFDHEYIFRIEEYPRELEIISDGAILAYSGDVKLNMLSRGLTSVNYSIGRVRPDDINHLITQSNGDLKNLRFRGSNFDQDNIAERYSGQMSTGASSNPKELSYFSLDMERYLETIPDKNMRNGLFFVNVWSSGRYGSYQDSRFVMVTDLGFVVKKNTDGTRDIFVQSLYTGKPVEYARVEVWGKNGNPVVRGNTDSLGHVSIPSLSEYNREMAPTAFVVKWGSDLSFMPYSGRGRVLDYSNFSVGGERGAQNPEKLNAFLFSDRGIYRPGDEINLGLIVKAGDWNIDLADTPLEISVKDPKGAEVLNERISLSSSGFEEITFGTMDYSPTGVYTASLYLIRERNWDKTFLGSATVKVEEFLPDTLNLAATFDPLPSRGWISPEGLQAKFSLKNLFGTPAVGNKISVTMSLSPGYHHVSALPGYIFNDPTVRSRRYEEYLGKDETDEYGEHIVDIDLSKFETATYNVRIHAEAFEKESGRSVEEEVSVLVSPLQYLVGYKADGSTQYVDKGEERLINFRGVNSSLEPYEVTGLRLIMEEVRFVSVLVKQPNGLYKYQSVRKSYLLNSRPFSVPKAGVDVPLPTDKGGEYVLSVVDADGTVLNSIDFSVMGTENIERSLNRSAELELRLEDNDLSPGETARVFIKAPYAGSGYITIERDRVYTYKWFTTDGSASVQEIQVPEDLEGNGYVNVTLLRDIASREIYMSPLSYGVVPFSVSKEKRINPVTIDIPDEARPGRPFPINIATAQPGKTIVFAVDEGILQVADYRTPQPISHFFKKRALEVSSSQILDLLLPEYSIFQVLGAIGGGGPGDDYLSRNLNPFKRKQQQPVVFWSGIIDTDSNGQTLNYDIPDYFNGTLRVMAVTVSRDRLGSDDESAIVRSPFVIQPNAPTVMAPGDEVEMSVTITNVLKDSGKGTAINLEILPSEHLELVGDSKIDLKIDEGRDETIFIKVKANNLPGAAELGFTAAGGNEEVTLKSYLSVRPVTPYRTALFTGSLKKEREEIDVARKTYEEFAIRDISLSYMPLGMSGGIMDYLDRFPYACSEQLVSITFPKLFPDLLKSMDRDVDSLEADIRETIQILQTRQNSSGGFGMWTARSRSSDLIDAYIMHFLTVARDKGYYVPQSMLEKGLNKLKDMASSNDEGAASADNRSYAIYVLTLNEIVTTSLIESLVKELEKQKDPWQDSFAGLFLAGSYSRLKLDSMANSLHRKINRRISWNWNQVYANYLSYAALHLYISATHFPDSLDMVKGELLETIVGELERQNYNTFSTCFSLLAIDSYMRRMPSLEAGLFEVAQVLGKEDVRTLQFAGEQLFTSSFSRDALSLNLENKTELPLYYQSVVGGFDSEIAEKTSNGIEVSREYLDAKGKVVSSAKLGDTITVRVLIRSTDSGSVSSIAIVELVPSGFEIDIPSARKIESKGSFRVDYVDIREDRLVVFGDAVSQVRTIEYTVRAINTGEFAVPPTYAESMYDTKIWAYNPMENFVIEK